MGEVYRSCVAMASAALVGLAYGAVADHYAPVSADSFLIVAGMSVALLIAASLRRAPVEKTAGRGGTKPGLCAGLAGFALLLVASEAFSHVSRASLLPQVLSALLFLLAIGYAVRCGAWLAACGATGFFVTAVAMLYCNSGGGWAGFTYVYCA
jgi:hypothetical protein